VGRFAPLFTFSKGVQQMTEVGLNTLDFIPVRYLNILKKQGITTVNELLNEFPSRYENYTPMSIKDAKLEENIVLEGNITSKVTLNYLKNRLTTLTFFVEVEKEVIKATLFNRQFLKSKLDYGVLVRMIGKFNQNFRNFTVSNIILCDEINRDIVPVYHIKDIGESKYLAMIEKVHSLFQKEIRDELPEYLNEKYHLIPTGEAIKNLHFPQSLANITEALRKMKYTEILKHQLSMKFIRYTRKNEQNGNDINYDETLINDFIKNLKFQLTPDQEQAVSDILANMRATYPMNRLLQGEVGSGKTIVAAIAMLAAVSAGYQAVLMCPTEILAYQHFETLSQAFARYDFTHVAVLTSSTSTHDRKTMLEDLATGKINVLIGTHALFQ
jgi:ATP-dependent DNA helicase RecG